MELAAFGPVMHACLQRCSLPFLAWFAFQVDRHGRVVRMKYACADGRHEPALLNRIDQALDAYRRRPMVLRGDIGPRQWSRCAWW